MARTGVDLKRPPQLPATHFVDHRVYTDQSVFEEEQDKIFGRIWKFICHESEVDDIYDFRTTDFGNTHCLLRACKTAR